MVVGARLASDRDSCRVSRRRQNEIKYRLRARGDGDDRVVAGRRLEFSFAIHRREKLGF
jgi:hypothetical protein